MKLGAALSALTLLCSPSDAFAFSSAGVSPHHKQRSSPRHTKQCARKPRGGSFLFPRGRRVAPLSATTVAPIADADSSDTRRSGSWPRRLPVIGRMLRRRSNKLQAVAFSMSEQELAVSSIAQRAKDELTKAGDKFIQQNMEQFAPAELFENEPTLSTVTPTVVAAPLPQVVDSPTTITAPSLQEASSVPLEAASESLAQPRASGLTRLSNGWVQNVLTRKLHRWSQGQHENVAVQCNFRSGLIDLMRGQLRCDASIDVDRIAFNTIRMSGGRVEAQRLALNLWSFLPSLRNPSKTTGKRRFPNQFDFVAKDVKLTQEDLFESPCIRNGLRRLLTRVLKVRGTNAAFVKISQIEVLPTGKLSVLGTATTIVGARVPFEVRTGLGFAGRGHVLTFPGLELSLSPGFEFFVPIYPDVTVDLGHNAQLQSVQLDGATGSLLLSARVTITPEHTVHLPNYRQSSSSYASPCSVDVGRWLTRLGQFSL